MIQATSGLPKIVFVVDAVALGGKLFEIYPLLFRSWYTVARLFWYHDSLRLVILCRKLASID